jgi:hypothetical protein
VAEIVHTGWLSCIAKSSSEAREPWSDSLGSVESIFAIVAWSKSLIARPMMMNGLYSQNGNRIGHVRRRLPFWPISLVAGSGRRLHACGCDCSLAEHLCSCGVAWSHSGEGRQPHGKQSKPFSFFTDFALKILPPPPPPLSPPEHSPRTCTAGTVALTPARCLLTEANTTLLDSTVA